MFKTFVSLLYGHGACIMLRYIALHYVMLRYVVLCYVMLC